MPASIPLLRFGIIRSDTFTEVPIEGWSNDGKKKAPNSFFGIEEADLEQKCLGSSP